MWPKDIPDSINQHILKGGIFYTWNLRFQLYKILLNFNSIQYTRQSCWQCFNNLLWHINICNQYIILNAKMPYLCTVINKSRNVVNINFTTWVETFLSCSTLDTSSLLELSFSLVFNEAVSLLLLDKLNSKQFQEIHYSNIVQIWKVMWTKILLIYMKHSAHFQFVECLIQK